MDFESLPGVLVVEDDDKARQRFCRIIEQHPALQLSGQAATLSRATELLLSLPADILLTDLELPDGNGIQLIRMIQQKKLDIEAMVITVFDDDRHVFSAIEAGATGYLLKESDAESVAQAILQVLAGGSPINPNIARRVLRRFNSGPLEPDKTETPENVLTSRESEVLALLGKGMSYGEVARILEISGGTVTTHIKHIYRKLAVQSRGEAVFEAMQRGLLRLDPP